jgi:hypothetical protein
MTPAVLVLEYTDQFVTKALEGATEASQHAQAAETVTQEVTQEVTQIRAYWAQNPP